MYKRQDDAEREGEAVEVPELGVAEHEQQSEPCLLYTSIRSVAQLISSISQALTLLPGTLISTGSPGGAGRSRKPPLYLRPGTEVTVSIEGIGELTSFCVEE